MDCLTRFVTPQLTRLQRGKVRDSFSVDDETRLIVVTDRLSAFDRVLDTPIPHKGEVLNRLAAWWFEATEDLAPNHLVRTVGPNACLVREAEPIRVEMVVRGFLTGSMWRGYARGVRRFSGVEVPDGLTANQRFEVPLVTPTTKEASDRPIDPEGIVAEGLATAARYDEMERIARALFSRGTRRLAERGLLLVDTKYEFGLVDGELVLIDEVHTPDSSRFWEAGVWDRDPAAAEPLDKEYVRGWLLDHQAEEPTLRDDVVQETSRRYLELYERTTGEPLAPSDEPVTSRLYRALVSEGLIRDGYVAVVMGSPVDLEHCQRIRDVVERYGVACDLRVMSAHKNGEAVVALAEEYNGSLEPGAVVAVAGRSNGLGGALSANLDLAVLSAPPFSDQLDMLTNITSSLMMPSKAPAATIIGAETAGMAALRCLNLPRLRARFAEDMARTKADLAEADRRIRGREA